MAHLNIIVLSGFLGSGKTTLLMEWLKAHPNNQVGIIVNEAGDIDIDGELIHSATKDQTIKRLPSGCLCCTLQSDVVDTVSTLLERKYELDNTLLDTIIIETSGISKPIGIVSPLLNSDLRKLNLNIQVVCVFDAVNGEKNLHSIPEVGIQLASAQRVIVSKLDCVNDQDLEKIVQLIKSVNPLAQTQLNRDRNQIIEELFVPQSGFTIANAYELLFIKNQTSSQQHPDIKVFTRTLNNRMEWYEVAEKLDDISYFFGEKLLRSKCLLNTQDSGQVLIQSVGHIFSQPHQIHSNASDLNSHLVFIMKDVSEEEFNSFFQKSFLNIQPIASSDLAFTN